MKATPTTSLRHQPLQLPALAQRLEAWRAHRSPGQRIPDRLWKAAADLARVHGLSPTATVLKLNYYDLQRRLRPAQRRRPNPPPPAQFVQLAPLAGSGPGTDPGTVEVLQPSGARLTLRLPHASPRQLLPLIQAILRS